MLKDLSRRSDQKELMDDFEHRPKNLEFVFDDINRVNTILGGNAITINAIAKLMKQHKQDSYVIVDMGCGDGYMLREVASYCRKQGIKAKFIGIDLNEEALQIARKDSMEFPEITYQCQDILALNPSEFQCDFLLCTLTVHHFTDAQIRVFLDKFAQLTTLGVIINDLQRSTLAYYLFKLFSLIFIKTKVAKIDGLISITKGFRKSDLISYSKHLPSVIHDIQWKWAFRYAWVMQPNLHTTI